MKDKKGRVTLAFKALEMTVEGNIAKFKGLTASYGNLDLGNDIIEPGAMKSADGEIVPLMLDHYDVIGITALSETSEGVESDGEINLDLEKGRETKSLIDQYKRFGKNMGMSIGYMYNDSDVEYVGGVRVLKKITIFESTITALPMNTDAEVRESKAFEGMSDVVTELKDLLSGFKTMIENFNKNVNTDVKTFEEIELAEEVTNWDADGASVRVKKWATTASKELDLQKYSKAFLLCQGDSKAVESYKLPFADVIDGKLKAVPKAIEAAAVELKSINDESIDKKSIETKLKSYKTEDTVTKVSVEDFKSLEGLAKRLGNIGGEK